MYNLVKEMCKFKCLERASSYYSTFIESYLAPLNKLIYILIKMFNFTETQIALIIKNE